MLVANHSSHSLEATRSHRSTVEVSAPRQSGMHERIHAPLATRLDFRDPSTVGGETRVNLRPMEKRLLSQLLVNVNAIVPTNELILFLYGNIDITAGRTRLKRLVADIRSRLGPAFARRLQTVHGVGLMWVDE
jgi:DNA-binding response OmpR family regulator